MGTIDPHTRELRYVSAGHDRPVLFRRSGGEYTARTLEGGGLVAGVSPGESYPVELCRLERGDVLVAFTDGLTDARAFDSSRLGRARLLEALSGALESDPDASAAALVERVFWTIRQFTGLQPQADDETLVVARIV